MLSGADTWMALLYHQGAVNRKRSGSHRRVALLRFCRDHLQARRIEPAQHQEFGGDFSEEELRMMRIKFMSEVAN